MSYRRHRPLQRPRWWPENEPWPPRRPPRHSPFLRRMGCLFLLFNMAGFAFFAMLLGLVAQALGIVQYQVDGLGWLLPLGAFFLVLLVMGWSVARVRRMSRPLDDLLKASQRLAERDYTIRVEEKGLPEVRSLARAFNSMAERLQASDQQRRALLADVTHELRTPLTVVQGNIEGMLDGVYPPDEARLKAVLDETRVLARLIDDLRTLALAGSGALQLKREPADVAVLVGETVAAFRSQAEAQGIRLEIRANSETPVIDLDPERIHQVLSNLITNALRYTPGGGTIEIQYGLLPEGLEIVVEDSGSGIPPDELPLVFERFYKSRDSDGLGLGLAIAKNLVEAHGGTITAASEPGMGTRMKIELPGNG